MKKRVSQETKNKIGRGVKTHYEKKGRKRKIGIALGVAGLTGAGLGLLALKKRGAKPGLGTPQNPYVERANMAILPDKTTTSNIKESFYDRVGKFRRKGQFMPKGQGEPMVGPRKQVIKVKPGYSREKYRPKDWVTIDTTAKEFGLKPYTVNFTKDELVHIVPTKIQSLVKDSIGRVRINFAKEEKVDSYTTKKGKRVRSFNRKRTKKEKQRSRLENVGAGLVGGYAALNVVGATAPNQLDINIATRKLANVLGDKNDPVFGKMRQEAYDKELNLNKKFRDIVDRETINKQFLENRAKYESALNTTDATAEMRQKAAERFKKKYGADIANPGKAKAAEAFNKNAAKMKQQAVVNNSLGHKAPGKVLRNAALIGLGAAGATKAYGIATRDKKKKKK
jgi:hypothetical protein